MKTYLPGSDLAAKAAVSFAQSRVLANDPMWGGAILASQEQSPFSMCVYFLASVTRASGGDYWDVICQALGVPSP